MQYRHRYDIKKADVRPVRIVASDFPIFSVLARYPFLSAPWIAALTGRKEGGLDRRLRELRRAGYVKLADAVQKRRNNNEQFVFQLDEKGTLLLQDKDIPIDTNEFSGQEAHRLMSCKVRASFEFGVTDSFKLYTWHELAAMGKIPDKTLKSDTPYMFPIPFRGKEIRIRPDTYPFVIEHPTEPKARYFILGVEVDCGTESIKSYDYTRQHIRTKYEHYSTFLKERLYRELLNFPDCVILFTTVSRIRMKTMMDLWREYAKDSPSLLHKVAFKQFKDEPNGWALSEPWYFADGSELRLDRP